MSKDKVRVWRSRAQAFTVAFALGVALVSLLKIFGPTELAGTLIIPLAMLFVVFWLSGLYSNHRYWKEFCKDEIQRGGSKQTAREKWRVLYPPMS
ncbi:hypothetical protein [Bradyrhizobium roseum]|uniref:hypothetical protein n=1 Tax=Bradyrhizobium roseum TaxID=3056648 RepID=UPI00260D002F|nr:hypothetical protein [Bradyrhizobium roseus]WKA26881.1 hypothetical protein QUH67_25335 [Bradyrhizobium roseus]